ncbi:adapter protein MecA 1/2 [Scopulibacillus daqui]|uniref:Adapter protein MecA n=1 Tax=Scopulibacillus daqui TaxID=1469162 RepID=A0ABS2PVF7_9BACL|nr:adaptor protein MecA [Scopulibacillus daqui]MBM7644034.1 adapter protein MecA 1/2 [Scopulibacillus daqui]
MDIERVNEYTLKFFISYIDIEDRGFDREEIWYNRERGEEFFWEIMDEAYYQESFSMDGPLWIQVQALDKGIEIIVTRAQLSQDGSKLELPISEDKHLDIPVSEGLEELINQHFQLDKAGEEDEDLPVNDDSDENHFDDELSFLISFSDFEDVVSLSHQVQDHPAIDTALYAFDNHYYLNITFRSGLSERKQDNVLSCILEYGFESNRTVHFVEEYGKIVLPEKALSTIRKHFPLQS